MPPDVLRFQQRIINLLQECEGSVHERQGMVHSPIYRSSTAIMPDYKSFVDPVAHGFLYNYCRQRNPVSDQVCATLCAIHHGQHAWLTSCGQAATHAVLASLLHHGDHLLIADNMYVSTRAMVTMFVDQYGVQVTYIDAQEPTAIAKHWQPNTKMVLIECVGSNTMEVHDIPHMAKEVHAHNGILVVDNTWGVAGLLCRPLELGADVVLESLTKYPCGHADMLAGMVCATNDNNQQKDICDRLQKGHKTFGHRLNADDSFAILRGFHSLVARVSQHWNYCAEIIARLQQHPLVSNVICPALPHHPQHGLWQRDFDGAHGLISITLGQNKGVDAWNHMVSGGKVWFVGASWGAYESLILPINEPWRTTMKHPQNDTFRLHVGLSSVDAQWNDLEQALKRYAEA